jgi:hypothetical protein
VLCSAIILVIPFGMIGFISFRVFQAAFFPLLNIHFFESFVIFVLGKRTEVGHVISTRSPSPFVIDDRMHRS